MSKGIDGVGVNGFEMNNEFKDLDFNSKKLEKRFIGTMQTLSKYPNKSILLASGSRDDAKAVYRMLGNNKFDISEVLKCHRENTIKRIIESGCNEVLVIQDTCCVSYPDREKTGMGYCAKKTMGIAMHTSLAVSNEGLAFGVLDQRYNTRADEKVVKDKHAYRPIEEKESIKWLEALENSTKEIPENIETITICDREGDIYELFDKAEKIEKKYLVRAVQDRRTTDNTTIIKEIKNKEVQGYADIIIPRDTRNNIPEREARLNITYANFRIKKSRILNQGKHLKKEININVVYAKEDTDGEDAIEWILLTNDKVDDIDDAYKNVERYVQRWKIERFHYVLKSGCNIEKKQERSVEKLEALMLMYSIIAVRILNLTHLGRINPEERCSVIFEEEEWKLLYCAANKTKKAPKKVYTIREALMYLSTLAGYKTKNPDEIIGVKRVWMGLQTLATIIEYRDYLY